MNKKEREIYKRQVHDIADRALVNAYRDTLDIASELYADVKTEIINIIAKQGGQK